MMDRVLARSAQKEKSVFASQIKHIAFKLKNKKENLQIFHLQPEEFIFSARHGTRDNRQLPRTTSAHQWDRTASPSPQLTGPLGLPHEYTPLRHNTASLRTGPPPRGRAAGGKCYVVILECDVHILEMLM